VTPRRALLIGCGNIGALYDLGKPGVLTHAKALASLGIPFDVVETDAARATRVTEAYGGQAYPGLEALDLGRYELVCVASSTATHAELLTQLLAAHTPLVICEKPLAVGGAALVPLKAAYEASRSIVVVNYLRRFQPGFIKLAGDLAARPGGARAGLRGIVARYQRGFINNAGHALDLLSFLLGGGVDFDELSVLGAAADAFPDDPTLAVSFRWADAAVLLLGLPDNAYGIFELQLDYQDARIAITDRGDRVDWLALDPVVPGASPTLALDPARSGSGLIADYMLPVFRHGLELLQTGAGRGNFPEAWDLNLKMARVLENLPPKR
jgi:predicted dehydrogenase